MKIPKPRLRVIKSKARYCNFCGKADDEVFCLLAGVGAMICDECAAEAQQIVNDKKIAAGACAVVQRVAKRQ